METFYKILIVVGCALFGYLTGSISSGIIISKIKYSKDPRNYGSHNSGGTNVGRTFGLKVGLLTILCDMLKTIIPLWITYFVLKYTALSSFGLEQYGYLACALCSVIGHCWPIYHQFKGGKAVSSLGGVVCATSWFLAVVGIPAFLLIFLLSHKVSLASILDSAFVSLLSFVLLICPGFFMNFGMQASIYYSITLILITCVLIYRHRTNIVRLIHHQENEIHLHKNKAPEEGK